MSIHVNSSGSAENQGAGFMSNRDAQWAQGMVLATLSKLCPKFSEYENDLMNLEKNYMIAGLRAARYRGYSQLGSGTATGLMGGATAIGGAVGVYQAGSLVKDGAGLYNEFYSQDPLNPGKLTEAQEALKAADVNAPNVRFNDDGEGNAAGTEIRLNQVQRNADGSLAVNDNGRPIHVGEEDEAHPNRPTVDRETQERKIKALETDFKRRQTDLNTKSQSIQMQTQAINAVGQFIGEPISKGFDLNGTLKEAEAQIYNSGSGNLGQMKGTAVSVYGEMVQGVGSLFSANAALAARV